MVYLAPLWALSNQINVCMICVNFFSMDTENKSINIFNIFAATDINKLIFTYFTESAARYFFSF